MCRRTTRLQCFHICNVLCFRRGFFTSDLSLNIVFAVARSSEITVPLKVHALKCLSDGLDLHHLEPRFTIFIYIVIVIFISYNFLVKYLCLFILHAFLHVLFEGVGLFRCTTNRGLFQSRNSPNVFWHIFIMRYSMFVFCHCIYCLQKFQPLVFNKPYSSLSSAKIRGKIHCNAHANH